VPTVHFGTDGLRGLANAELTGEVAMALGRAAARVLPARAFVVGRDTRRSGPLLQAALSAGIAAEGADVIDLGVLPTPGVAHTAAVRGLPGAVISASHNPFGDNGIKVFGAGGTKLPESAEAGVEAELRAVLEDPDGPPRRPTGHGVGGIAGDPGAAEAYCRHLRDSIGGRSLEGMRLVLDCANGASSGFAPGVFSSLGAEVTALSCEPDGANINDGCGSTCPEKLAAQVVSSHAALGLAFDGDADRMIAVDHTGGLADGDVLLGLFALDLRERGLLAHDAVAVTVMSNLGFRLAMAERGIGVVETPVGDRHILEALEAQDLALGGEQSGHIVFRMHATTGDGMLTGVLLADLLRRRGASLEQLTAGLITRVPQIMVNVSVPDPGRIAEAEEVWSAVAEVEAELGERGRVLLRPSGTEPLVRVMVEALSEVQAEACADRLAAAVRGALTPLAG
jgi:phosphoglucosamine mutase